MSIIASRDSKSVLSLVSDAVLSFGISCSSSSIGVPCVGELLGDVVIGFGSVGLVAFCSHPITHWS